VDYLSFFQTQRQKGRGESSEQKFSKEGEREMEVLEAVEAPEGGLNKGDVFIVDMSFDPK